MTDIRISDAGTIVSYTVLHMPPEGFQPPVLLALVRLDDGATALCLGEAAEIANVRIGAHVRVYRDLTDRFMFHVIS